MNQLQLNLHQAAYTGQGSKFPLIRQNFPIIDNHHAHFRGKREFVLNLHIQKLADQSTKHIFYKYTYYDVTAHQQGVTYKVLNMLKQQVLGDLRTMRPWYDLQGTFVGPRRGNAT